MLMRRKIEKWWCILRTSLNLSIEYSQQTFLNNNFSFFHNHYLNWLWVKMICTSSTKTYLILDWWISRSIMDSLSLAIKKCNLDLLLDNPTDGFGNCFPNALVQQCRRPEIKTWLQKNRPWAIFNGHQSVRTKITNFALKSKDQAITNLRAKYEQVRGPAENKSWNEYWNLMGKDGTWVDHIFIQMTAWYMTLDILILTTSSKPENPFIVISGHTNITHASDSDPPLLLGN